MVALTPVLEAAYPALNADQRAVVAHGDGPLLVVAVAVAVAPARGVDRQLNPVPAYQRAPRAIARRCSGCSAIHWSTS